MQCSALKRSKVCSAAVFLSYVFSQLGASVYESRLRERKIPFEIKAASRDEVNAKGWDAIMQLGKRAEEADIQDMPIEEINSIIKEVRDAK